MSSFVKRSNNYFPTVKGEMLVMDYLPAEKTYSVSFSQESGFYLTEVNSLTVKGKIYGDTEKKARRIINTFQQRPFSTGVMLAGEKGSGKTLMSKLISQIAREELNIPTIIVNTGFCGPAFNKFIQDIEGECVVIFDEFEKIYDKEDQEKILTLFDGVFPSRKLFIVTLNDSVRVDTNIKNRPGRMYYHIEYEGLSKEFIVEYCEDNLNNKEHISDFLKISSLFYRFNFDMLTAMVEECNRYNEGPMESVGMLNVKPTRSNEVTYKLELFINNLQIERSNMERDDWRGSPLYHKNLSIAYFKNSTDSIDDDDTDGNWMYEMFTYQDMRSNDPVNGVIIYVNSNGNMVRFTEERDNFNPMSAY